MPLPVSYMGTKRQLAAFVSELVERSSPGPMLDVFAGMCAVGSAVAPKRQVWTNDLQHFAHAVASAHFCSSSPPPSRMDALACTMATYSKHLTANSSAVNSALIAEHQALDAEDSEALRNLYAKWRSGTPVDGNPISYVDKSLFRDTFAGSFFGLSQSIEIDAIRVSIDAALHVGDLDTDQHRWLVLALCVALSKVSASTGHFAQPLSPKSNNIRRIVKQRRISVRSEWLKAIEHLTPLGDADWRRGNRSFRGDALDVLYELSSYSEKPSVVYADPPYTSDQYSRYYHIFETALLYDYPDAIGTGRYRSDRAVSTFSLSSQVHDSLSALVTSCSNAGCDLIISYPTNGLLKDSLDVIPSLIKAAYGCDPEIYQIAHQHSTMGASKGAVKSDVTEVIYRAFH